MKKDEVKEYIKVLNAYVEGKTIQVLIDDIWLDIEGEVNFTCRPSEYRIKPVLMARRYVYEENNTYYLAFAHPSHNLVGIEGSYAFVKWIDTNWVEYEI